MGNIEIVYTKLMKIIPHFTTQPNPGTESHLREILAAELKAKGLPLEQEYINGVPQHHVWYELIEELKQHEI